jgi:hypothetical protein
VRSGWRVAPDGTRCRRDTGGDDRIARPPVGTSTKAAPRQSDHSLAWRQNRRKLRRNLIYRTGKVAILVCIIAICGEPIVVHAASPARSNQSSGSRALGSGRLASRGLFRARVFSRTSRVRLSRRQWRHQEKRAATAAAAVANTFRALVPIGIRIGLANSDQADQSTSRYMTHTHLWQVNGLS